MAYCGPLGMPLSRFLRWDRDDQDAALLWSMRERAAHPACGTRPDEWDPELGGDHHAYIAEVRSCRGCETRDSMERRLSEDARRGGGYVVLVPNPDVGADR